MTRSRASSRKASRARNCSSSWRWRTSRRPRTCSGRFTTEPVAWTVGFRWKSRLCWRTTPNRRLPWPRTCTRGRERPNLLIKIPGTPEGLPAIEEAIFAGVPVNVTLLFSDDQYLAAADAFMRGIERRIDAGLQPDVGSVASIFISRWDVAVAGKVPETLNNQLGIAVAKRTYKAYLGLLSSPRWMRAYNAGARPQRLLWASTGTKDPKASDVLYIKALAAPFTVNTMPEGTLKALAEPRRRRGDDAGGRRRLRRGAGAVRRGEDRRPGAGGPASRRRRQVVRQFVERPDGRDRIQIRRPQASELAR